MKIICGTDSSSRGNAACVVARVTVATGDPATTIGSATRAVLEKTTRPVLLVHGRPK